MHSSLSPREANALHAAVVREGLPTGDVASFVAAARSALDLARVDDAAALAKAALALSPAHAPAWVVLGDAAWAAGDARAAANAWEEALSLDDRDLGTAVACARAKHALADSGGARALLTFVLTRVHSEELRQTALALLQRVEAGGAP